jgi:hypothetical protein
MKVTVHLPVVKMSFPERKISDSRALQKVSKQKEGIEVERQEFEKDFDLPDLPKHGEIVPSYVRPKGKVITTGCEPDLGSPGQKSPVMYLDSEVYSPEEFDKCVADLQEDGWIRL